MGNRKKFSELNLNNAFLFAAAMQDEEICRLVLEMILGESIETVRVNTEKTILLSSDYRCVRLDVYASDAKSSYNVEMQNQNEHNLPKRSRFHQAELDMSSLNPGDDFNDLKPCVIIFLCTFDPFGKGLYQYTYTMRCEETGDELGDGVKKIFLNTKGANDSDVPQVLIHFLKYLENSTESYVEVTGSDKVRSLHKKIVDLKRNRVLEGNYMTLEEWMKSEVKEEVEKQVKEEVKKVEKQVKEKVEKQVKEESEKFLKLTSYMAADGRSDDIKRLLEEPAFLEEMLKKYQL